MRGNQPLVSVIIASYNHAPYIESSIRSVLTQTYQNIELLVIDDGSHDDSVGRIQRLQAAYGFDFTVQGNRGLARTLNEAIARSSGELIVPFGSDDVMLPERIAVQAAYMDGKPEVGICAGNIQYIDRHGKLIEKRNRDLPFRRLSFDDIFLGRVLGVPAPTLMFRRNAIELVGGFDPEIRLEDLLIELKITSSGLVVDVLPDVLAQYRVHETNTYKNHRLMVDSVLRTYAHFKEHPAYEIVCGKFRNSILCKCARQDKKLAIELLKELPLRFWDGKTLRALWRMALPPKNH